MKLHPGPLAAAIFVGSIQLTVFLWFLWKQRRSLKLQSFIRHVVLMLFVYTASLSFAFGDKIAGLILGHEIHKGDSDAFIAGIIILGCPIFFLTIGVLLLGKDRVREFNRYVEVF